MNQLNLISWQAGNCFICTFKLIACLFTLGLLGSFNVLDFSTFLAVILRAAIREGKISVTFLGRKSNTSRGVGKIHSRATVNDLLNKELLARL